MSLRQIGFNEKLMQDHAKSRTKQKGILQILYDYKSQDFIKKKIVRCSSEIAEIFFKN